MDAQIFWHWHKFLHAFGHLSRHVCWHIFWQIFWKISRHTHIIIYVCVCILSLSIICISFVYLYLYVYSNNFQQIFNYSETCYSVPDEVQSLEGLAETHSVTRWRGSLIQSLVHWGIIIHGYRIIIISSFSLSFSLCTAISTHIL